MVDVATQKPGGRTHDAGGGGRGASADGAHAFGAMTLAQLREKMSSTSLKQLQVVAAAALAAAAVVIVVVVDSRAVERRDELYFSQTAAGSLRGLQHAPMLGFSKLRAAEYIALHVAIPNTPCTLHTTLLP